MKASFLIWRQGLKLRGVKWLSKLPNPASAQGWDSKPVLTPKHMFDMTHILPLLEA